MSFIDAGKDQITMKGLETVMGLLHYHCAFLQLNPLSSFFCTGYAARVGQYADSDCVLVQVLYDCGAVPFVRTNVPQTLMVSVIWRIYTSTV